MVFLIENEISKEAVISYIRNLILKKPYEVVISRKKEKRSVSQNSLMWMWFECLAHETGHTKEQFHEHYCNMFLKKLSPIDGQMVVGGTRALTKDAFTDFLNKVQADAASYFGVILPTPEDLYWSEFENYFKQFVK